MVVLSVLLTKLPCPAFVILKFIKICIWLFVLICDWPEVPLFIVFLFSGPLPRNVIGYPVDWLMR